jgi:flavodoxin
MANTLVVYYSRKGENHMPGGVQVLEKGHTERAAEFIAKALNADLFEIDTVKPYAENYRACCGEAFAEFKAAARPEIKGYVEDISGYETVFVCFPCWCGTAPMCVYTFLEHYDFTGKKIVPLCTNEGSGMANSEADIAKSCPGANVVSGLSVRGHKVIDSESEIAAWAKENA